MRKLFRRSAVLLLALFFIATVAIWIRSYWAYDAISLNWSQHHRAAPSIIQVDERQIDLDWGSGSLEAAYEYDRNYPPPPIVDATRLHIVHFPVGKPIIGFGPTEWVVQLERLGFCAWKESYGLSEILAPGLDQGYTRTTVTLPIGFLTALPGFLVFFAWIKTRRRFPKGRCLSCGYDLTGNVSGTCPECGAQFRQRISSQTIDGIRHA